MQVERLRERFEIIVANFDPKVELLPRGENAQERGLLNICDVGAIHKAMELDPVYAAQAGTVQRFNQVLAGKYTRLETPRRYAKYVSSLFPQVPEYIIMEPKFSAFEKFVQPTIDAKNRWEEAQKHLTKNRDQLSRIMKGFYFDVDDSNSDNFLIRDFPLVTKSEWILKIPLLLQKKSDLSTIRDLAGPDKMEIPLLAGLNLSCIEFRSMLLRQTRMKKWGYPFFNGATYRIVSVEGDDLNSIEYGISDYFSYVNTCEYIALELADAHLRNGDRLSDLDLSFRSTPDAIYDFSQRTCFPGVNCLTIGLGFKNKRNPNHRDVYWIHKRGSSTMEAQNCVHVVPAGGHQPLGEVLGSKKESQLYWTAVREFIEEFFNKEDLIQRNNGSPDWLEEADLKSLHDAFFIGTNGDPPPARIFLLGMGFDPVTTKPEILVAIVVDWKKVASWSSPDREISWNPEADGDEVPLSAENLRKEARGFVREIDGLRLPTLPAGAACMMIAAEHLDSITSISE